MPAWQRTPTSRVGLETGGTLPRFQGLRLPGDASGSDPFGIGARSFADELFPRPLRRGSFFRFLRTPALPQNVLRKRLFAFALDAHCVLCGIRRWYATNAAGRYHSEDQQWRASFVGGKFHSLILLHLWGLPDAQFVEPMDHKSKKTGLRQA